ncbi:MAG: hypothetical protein BRC47_06235 [Cyanobacteria bacterium QS_7_48_42]|nr:MAG: hypothetical protein BRC35_07760 [Cyanobacteria bacterium QH_10_48_56]PSO78529.1 MAG: hypothetical protein BRC37_00555 [Cyanobacteria bacterium QH_3_48_40]PSO79546.1 MAG: hypothetical protein BRC44_08425 [Cyanobacteria bacterium QS_4_48_99]PSO94384.1 MAG: hypothetical protein BRC46_04785 [Cyanobacteria bacterium QS_6_48_18]PSO98740.1 MAG: hypothetical protein BRC53_04850 [Cyanobacteria bacterium SW_6_48_11]PSP03237.1 MAG: hypothetical protein BRC47_06235 [Cyanobacteria bacterium QS_7_4
MPEPSTYAGVMIGRVMIAYRLKLKK